MKVKTDFEDCYYITAGKVYQAKPDHGYDHCLQINDDEGDVIVIARKGCAHLNGNDWEIIDD